MRKAINLSLVLMTGLTCLGQEKKMKVSHSYQNIHRKAILVDTHNDFLTKTMDYGFAIDQDLRGKTYSDLKRWKQGGVDVQFFFCF